MRTPARLSVGLVSTVSFIALAVTLVLVPAADAQVRSRDVVTVSMQSLCRSFGAENNGFSCQGGSAESDGALVDYAAHESIPDFQYRRWVTVMRAKDSTCNKMSLSFWASNDIGFVRVRILTKFGTTEAESTGNSVASITARIGKGPFRVRVYSGGDSSAPERVFFNGSAKCTSTTGK